LKQYKSKESTCVTLSIKYSFYIHICVHNELLIYWFGTAISDLWGLAAATPVPAPLFDAAENRSLYSYRPSLLQDLGAKSLKYKW